MRAHEFARDLYAENIIDGDILKIGNKTFQIVLIEETSLGRINMSGPAIKTMRWRNSKDLKVLTWSDTDLVPKPVTLVVDRHVRFNVWRINSKA